MNDPLLIALLTWAYWLLIAIVVVSSIDPALKIVNHFLDNYRGRTQKTCTAAKCSRCEVSDPAFAHVCQVPVSGKRET